MGGRTLLIIILRDRSLGAVGWRACFWGKSLGLFIDFADLGLLISGLLLSVLLRWLRNTCWSGISTTLSVNLVDVGDNIRPILDILLLDAVLIDRKLVAVLLCNLCLTTRSGTSPRSASSRARPM